MAVYCCRYQSVIGNYLQLVFGPFAFLHSNLSASAGAIFEAMKAGSMVSAAVAP